MTRCVVVLAMLLFAGCGDGKSSPSSTGSAGTPTMRSAAWRPLITLAELGSFTTRCARRGGQDVFAASFTVNPMTATSTVSMSTNGGRAARRVLQPGQRWVSALAATRVQAWHIAQGTEAQTVTATVRIWPSRCPYGVPTTDVHYGTSHFNSP